MLSKNVSVKYYQENKERLHWKARERYKNPCKEEKERKPRIWLWTLQTFFVRWKTKYCWV